MVLPPPIWSFVGMAAVDSFSLRRESGQKIMKLMLGAHWLLNDLRLACYRGVGRSRGLNYAALRGYERG